MDKIGFNVGEYEGTRTTQDDRQIAIDRLYDELQYNASMAEWDTLNDDYRVAMKLNYYRRKQYED